MSQPLVSIIIPCYNGEAFIGRAIQSALDQTYPNCEIIVIDDGSTDSSLDVIKSFGGRTRWETGENRGGSAARNRGIDLAKGEYIQFLDADDILDENKVSAQLPEVMSGTADVVFCDWNEMSVDGSVLQRAAQADPREDPVVLSLKSGIPTPTPIHLRTNLQKVGGFRAGLQCCQERDLQIRMACVGMTFHRLEKTLVTVYKHSDSVSFDLKRVLFQHQDIAVHAIDILKGNKAFGEERAKAFAEFLVRDGRYLLRMGEKYRAYEYFKFAQDLHNERGMGSYGPAARFLCNITGHAFCEKLICLYRSLKKSGNPE